MPPFVRIGTQKVIIVDAQTGDPIAQTPPQTGSQGNAWNGASVGADGNSPSVDKQGYTTVSAFGTVSAATTLTLQVSQNNSSWYDTDSTVDLAGAGDFHLSVVTAARYVRLNSSAAATITATIVAG